MQTLSKLSHMFKEDSEIILDNEGKDEPIYIEQN